MISRSRLRRTCRRLVRTIVQQTWRRRRRRISWLPPALVSSLQQAAPKAVPQYPEARRSATEVCRLADEMLASGVPMGEGRRLPMEAVSWRRDPFGGRGSIAALLFHALYPVELLLQAHAASAQFRYLERARAMTDRWIAECLDDRSERLWDDHGTALRAITLCRLWLACRVHEVEPSFGRRLLTALATHGEILAAEDFHRPTHNHGIVQAYALLSVGLVLSGLPGARAWIARARARLEAQMADNVSAEGLHREHSPAYHFFALRHFLDAWKLARACGERVAEPFATRLQAMLASATDLLKPDGAPAALGDTCRSSPLMIDAEDLEEWPSGATDGLMHVLTAGARGRAALSASRLLHGAGYAVLRSGRDASDGAADERYLVVRTATYRTAHIHRDVGSFELYGHGEDLIVDAGGPYAYGHRIRAELMRTAAHNTIVVDGRDQAVGEAEVLRWATGSTVDVLDIRHRLYPRVSHRRLFALVKPRAYVLIVDRLEAEDVHRYAQVFHLSPALDVSIRGHVLSTNHRSGGPTVRIVPALTDDLGVRLERGGSTADRGWICVAKEQLVPDWAVGYERAARSTTFVTLLLPERPGAAREVEATIEGAPLTGECRVAVRGAEIHDDIVIPADGAVRVVGGGP